MARGLLSRLVARDPARRIDEVQSILENLRSILNTRLGDSLSSPLYGVLDFSDACREFPQAVPEIQRSIRQAISTYEPRLRNVRVRPLASDDPLVLSFEVSARLASDPKRGLVRVRTDMTSDGKLQVV